MALRHYSVPVVARDTAGAAVDSLVWSARNTSGRMVWVKEIYLSVGFDGTAAASSSLYNLIRFRTASPTGGTAVTPISLRGIGGASLGAGIVARVAEGGLTVTSVTFETPWAQIGHPRQAGAVPFHAEDACLELPAGDGLGIRLGLQAVAGDSITGWVTFTEKTE